MSRTKAKEFYISEAENGWLISAGSAHRPQDMRPMYVAETVDSLLDVVRNLAE